MRHLALMMCLAFVPPVWADLPTRQSGLWEVKSESRAPGLPQTGAVTFQLCVDSKQDHLLDDPQEDVPLRERCSKLDIKRTGDGFTVHAVCREGRHTITSTSRVTGDARTRYRVETDSKISPPMEGVSSMKSVVEGRRIGACKPGQQHGSMTMMGVPGMGNFQMDAETMRQIQQMQKQYGR